jgi:SAM-dependent methyltransferase
MVGTIEFPALPALAEHVWQRVIDMLALYGHTFSREAGAHLRGLLDDALAEGYRASCESRVVFQFKTPPEKGLEYEIGVRTVSMEERYQTWEATRPHPLFGELPDAMVMNAAASLGAPSSVRVLDVGAGTGRNAMPLARQGHPVTAIEPVGRFAEEIRRAADGEGLAVAIVEGDFLSSDVELAAGDHQLVVIAEVLTHFRDLSGIRRAFEKIAHVLSPGGLVVASLFVADHGYKPDPLAKQVGEMAWSTFYTPAELDFITAELPFERVREESVYDYEKANLPPSGWPPTGWFEDWANGRNVFLTAPGIPAPIELRWMLFRRRA